MDDASNELKSTEIFEKKRIVKGFNVRVTFFDLKDDSNCLCN